MWCGRALSAPILGPDVLADELGERIVGDDDLVGHAEQLEQHRRDDAGAVLARRAVEDQRDGIVGGDALHDPRQHRSDAARDPEIDRTEIVHLGQRIVIGDIGAVERQMVQTHGLAVGEGRRALERALARMTQIHDGAHAELAAHALDVAVAQRAQCIRAEEMTPAHAPAFAIGVPA